MCVVRTIFCGQGLLGSDLEVVFVLLEGRRVDLDFGGSQGRGRNKVQVGVADQLAGQPEEGLLKVVVALCRDVVVLQVLFAVERDGLCLDFALLSCAPT